MPWVFQLIPLFSYLSCFKLCTFFSSHVQHSNGIIFLLDLKDWGWFLLKTSYFNNAFEMTDPPKLYPNCFIHGGPTKMPHFEKNCKSNPRAKRKTC
jgi:hypothetical protein